jgi:hypothetical protein
VNVEVGVGLFAGREGAVAFGVGHCSVDHYIAFLHIGQKAAQAAVVRRPVLLVREKRDVIEGVQAVEADTSLEATARLPSQEPDHLDLSHQVVGALVDVSETVDPPSAEVRRGGGQVLIARLVGQVVGHGRRVDVRPGEGMVHDVIDLGPEGVDVALQPAKALPVLVPVHHGRTQPAPAVSLYALVILVPRRLSETMPEGHGPIS